MAVPNCSRREAGSVIAILGVVIGGIVVALFLPIFKLPTMIH